MGRKETEGTILTRNYPTNSLSIPTASFGVSSTEPRVHDGGTDSPVIRSRLILIHSTNRLGIRSEDSFGTLALSLGLNLFIGTPHIHFLLRPVGSLTLLPLTHRGLS